MLRNTLWGVRRREERQGHTYSLQTKRNVSKYSVASVQEVTQKQRTNLLVSWSYNRCDDVVRMVNTCEIFTAIITNGGPTVRVQIPEPRVRR